MPSVFSPSFILLEGETMRRLLLHKEATPYSFLVKSSAWKQIRHFFETDNEFKGIITNYDFNFKSQLFLGFYYKVEITIASNKTIELMFRTTEESFMSQIFTNSITINTFFYDPVNRKLLHTKNAERDLHDNIIRECSFSSLQAAFLDGKSIFAAIDRKALKGNIFTKEIETHLETNAKYDLRSFINFHRERKGELFYTTYMNPDGEPNDLIKILYEHHRLNLMPEFFVTQKTDRNLSRLKFNQFKEFENYFGNKKQKDEIRYGELAALVFAEIPHQEGEELSETVFKRLMVSGLISLNRPESYLSTIKKTIHS